ncbi:MAG TPA: hypothetical protein VMX16_11770 [Terriglobia bacterium]|nr:hypothetical protein [Terriglobia bacterium]
MAAVATGIRQGSVTCEPTAGYQPLKGRSPPSVFDAAREAQKPASEQSYEDGT